MTVDKSQKRKHFIFSGTASREKFRSPKAGGSTSNIPEQDRMRHGQELLTQLRAIELLARETIKIQKSAGLQDRFGLQIQFESFPDIDFSFESLERRRSKIEILNVKQNEQHTSVSVFVPDGKLEVFEKLINEYIEEKRDKNGKICDHKKLMNSIQRIGIRNFYNVWADMDDVLPKTETESIWWEVWLSAQKNKKSTTEFFRQRAKECGFEVAPGELIFPERTVLLVHGSQAQFQDSLLLFNNIAELRRAKEATEFFDSISPIEQSQWLDNLLDRSEYISVDQDASHVCLLDTGVNNGHRLLTPALADQDLHAVEPAWGTADHNGHGTEMAGLALIGDLAEALDSDGPLRIGHRLESVKLIQNAVNNEGNSPYYGYLTTEAVSRPEVNAPRRLRVFGMAVTAPGREEGRPSSWSAAMDDLAADGKNDGRLPRLFIISAGNIRDNSAWLNYPNSNKEKSIEDPGQAWNALTVGAYTRRVDITEADARDSQPVAPMGGLSPFSATSIMWEKDWPLKPDVVFEGGNVARDQLGAVSIPSLGLLTANYEPHKRTFTITNATSAAMAFGARMAAQLRATYPELWPETIRALIVHSAEWTDAMRAMFLKGKNKSDCENLVRHCGFGVPDLDRALWSTKNSLTLIVQDNIQPFTKNDKGGITLEDMHLHKLAWPLKELEDLGQTPVELRVTLSYFIEPNPSGRGFNSRYCYASYGLRFDVRRATETLHEFRARINEIVRKQENIKHSSGSNDSEWSLGPIGRHRGSLHSDIWKGTAADLANRGVLAIYPTSGWWKTRPFLQCHNRKARYALVVSIKTAEIPIDLYQAIAAQIQIPIEV